MADMIKIVLNDNGCGNAAEYVYSVTGSRNIPQILGRKIIRRIREDSVIYSPDLLFLNDVLLDKWGQPITIMLTTNHIGEAGIVMHSFGKNKRNENGGGDDIVMWFNADMSPSREDPEASRIWLEECLKGLYNPPQ